MDDPTKMGQWSHGKGAESYAWGSGDQLPTQGLTPPSGAQPTKGAVPTGVAGGEDLMLSQTPAPAPNPSGVVDIPPANVPTLPGVSTATVANPSAQDIQTLQSLFGECLMLTLLVIMQKGCDVGRMNMLLEGDEKLQYQSLINESVQAVCSSIKASAHATMMQDITAGVTDFINCAASIAEVGFMVKNASSAKTEVEDKINKAKSEVETYKGQQKTAAATMNKEAADIRDAGFTTEKGVLKTRETVEAEYKAKHNGEENLDANTKARTAEYDKHVEAYNKASVESQTASASAKKAQQQVDSLEANKHTSIETLRTTKNQMLNAVIKAIESASSASGQVVKGVYEMKKSEAEIQKELEQFMLQIAQQEQGTIGDALNKLMDSNKGFSSLLEKMAEATLQISRSSI